jgi:hypothetical protein
LPLTPVLRLLGFFSRCGVRRLRGIREDLGIFGLQGADATYRRGRREGPKGVPQGSQQGERS